MFENIRFKLAEHYARKSKEFVDKGGYKNIKKGIKYLKKSVFIVPPSDELRLVGARLRKVAEEQREKLYEEERA